MQKPNIRYLMVVTAVIASCLLLFLQTDAGRLVANGHLSTEHLYEIDFMLDGVRFAAFSIGVALAMHATTSLLGLESNLRWIIAVAIPSLLLFVIGTALGLDWLSNMPIHSTTEMLGIISTFPFRFAIGFAIASVGLDLLHRLVPLASEPAKAIGTISHPQNVG